MREFTMDLTDDDLQIMTVEELKKIVKIKERETSFKELTASIKFKGSDLSFHKLEMSSYLTSSNPNPSIDDKRRAFKIRSDMGYVAKNFSKSFPNKMCQMGCSIIEDYGHILVCPQIYNLQQQYTFP